MSLNDIQLSASQLAELYGRNLITPPDGEETPISSRPRPQTSSRQETAVTASAAPAEPVERPEPAIAPEPRTASPEPRTPNSELRTPDSIQFLGKNQQRITILVNSPKEVYLPEGELSFLTNILLACRLHLGDVAIVNHARQPTGPVALHEQLQSRFILVFGVSLPDPALAQQPSFIPLAQDGYTIVLAPPLSQLNSTGPDAKLLKSKLWVCLKQLFNV